MTDFDPALVERLRVILFGNATFGTDTAVEAIRVRAALRALPLSAAALNALWRGEAVVVPWSPTALMVENHQHTCAGDADEAGPQRIQQAYRAMLAASPYAKETKDG